MTQLHRRQAELAQRDTDDIDSWVSIFAQLGDPTRLRILLALHRAPGIVVADVAAAAGVTANAASHALASLAARGFAAAQRDGRHRRWSLVDSRLHTILHTVGAKHSDLHPSDDH